jgi:Ala-tRNA(Pro) deacylase
MKNFDIELLHFLGEHDVTFDYFEHIPVFTVEESEQIKHNIPWTHTKNLFLSDKKGWFYLVSIAAHKRFPINAFRKAVGMKECSFASAEQLYQKLHLIPGSVSLFWLIYDRPPTVHVYLDEDLSTATQVGRHPNRNDATIVLDKNMIKRFLQCTTHQAKIISFDDLSVTIQ